MFMRSIFYVANQFLGYKTFFRKLIKLITVSRNVQVVADWYQKITFSW